MSATHTLSGWYSWVPHLVVWSPTLTLCGVQCTHNVQLECKQTVRDCFVSFPLPAFLVLLGFCCPMLVVTSILLPLVWLWSQCNICTHSSYMVDAADHEKLDASKNELHSLLDKPQLAGIPVRPPSPLSIIFCPLFSPSPSFPAPLVDYSRKWIINWLYAVLYTTTAIRSSEPPVMYHGWLLYN